MIASPFDNRVRIDIYSHFVKVSNYNALVREALKSYCSSHLVEWTRRWNGRTMVQEMKCVYVSANADRRVFRFHRNVLDQIYRVLESVGYGQSSLHIVEHSLFEPAAVKFTRNPKDRREPRGEQPKIIDYLTSDCLPPYAPSKMVEVQTGGGKDQVLTDLIKVPGGWRPMGQMQVGDRVVAWDGTITSVTGVFPQGLRTVYRVTTSDGRVVTCGAQHLWQVWHTPTDGQARWGTVTTLELQRLCQSSDHEVSIPLITPEGRCEQNLPVDPYQMGTLLMRADPAMVELFQDQESRYLHGSIQQRWQLLQGCMDAGGQADEDGTVRFVTNDPDLAATVQYLVRSLGGIAQLDPSDQDPSRYCVQIQYSAPARLFWRSPYRTQLFQQTHPVVDRLRIQSVELAGQQMTQCISIDHPDRLYVTNDFTVTHNTFMLLTAMDRLQTRTVLFLSPRYIKKWVSDIKEAFSITKKDLMVVQGSKDLKNLIAHTKAGDLRAKVIIVSIPTFRNYLGAWESHNGIDREDYGADPEQFYELLGAGLKVVDEAHQEFHAVFRQDLFTHIPRTISLSATMLSDNPFMNTLYEMAWPLPTRSPKIEYRKYIIVRNIWYSVNGNPAQIRCVNYFKQYSHVMFEQWIMKKPARLSRYYEMVEDVVRRTYVETAEPGQKALVFCATKEMCTYMREQLQMSFPDRRVSRYIQGDDYQKDLLEPDLTVTTLKSAGTAVDIPDLAVCICTVAVSSKQANEQAVGRLRELKNWPEQRPVFYFLSAREIDKHRQYAYEKSRKLDGKVLAYEELNSTHRI